jgi:hypothetical protein
VRISFESFSGWEWAGKLNFYLSAVDDLFRTGPDAPIIGLLLCESHRGAIVEYTLRSIEKPIGVSNYRVLGNSRSQSAKRFPLLRICRKSSGNFGTNWNLCARRVGMKNKLNALGSRSSVARKVPQLVALLESQQ